jgi:hypothetical protein
MAQKTQTVSASGDLPTSSASSVKDTTDSAQPQKSNAPGTSNSGPSTQPPKLTELDAALRPTSQSTAKPASSGSAPSPKDAVLETASPYGTRSRNRTGNSRPNYAEDKDIDTETYDYYSEKRDQDMRKGARQSSSTANPAQEGQRSNGSARKAATTEDGKNTTSHNAAKEQHSGPAAPTGNSATHTNGPPATKKRKAAAQSVGGPQSQPVTVQPAASTSGPPRRVATLSQGGYPETNMLSFENCNARPVNGKLVADDGTVLEPNGNAIHHTTIPGAAMY